ncbi:Spx/MgsR family RNA polymerase-binding regulatory protein [Loigolactobacillus backii]|uniref:Uncharacterized protein n=1 Tax=Loigolactobacillus backii TaxID=375175 RepID=A0A192H1D9_9LACO|nr:Spx/MgsR family RNA polymerase-binding regulatory protein [Loigolactobacillus backii]ANK60670.1 hypothetical protein AYR52_10670 [Loigolactobacillus backii]ANK61761.1 hypothetical protein AYR53_02645 [Loigolactobacillus backii]ANK65624.1 hypothetical protein AYR54_10470 [Loigolactobacillus backii]ANK69045.1 hypothetical protein AYR56_02075 [Loigolactobacillus backii]MDA5387207.1 Spx/MgsR family RNA polymerase-binding regulatory protein [Loigolactobacillus backii]
MITLFYSSNCTSSRKALKWLEQQQIPFVKRYIKKAPPTVNEIKQIMQYVDNGIDDILATRYKGYPAFAREMGEMTTSQIFQRLHEEPELLRRPIILSERKVNIGYNSDAIRTFIPRERRHFDRMVALLNSGM